MNSSKYPHMKKLVSIWKPTTWFSSWKYLLLEEWSYSTKIVGYSGTTGYVTITVTGMIVFEKGYAWDGTSGPTWDTPSCRRGALVHDGLYQLMRECILPANAKERADQLLHDLCVEDGMLPFRAWYWKKGVELFGRAARKRGG